MYVSQAVIKPDIIFPLHSITEPTNTATVSEIMTCFVINDNTIAIIGVTNVNKP